MGNLDPRTKISIAMCAAGVAAAQSYLNDSSRMSAERAVPNMVVEIYRVMRLVDLEEQSNVSPKAKRETFERPRQLTPSETVSLRQDAISVSTEMKGLMKERQNRQKWSIRRIIGFLDQHKDAAE